MKVLYFIPTLLLLLLLSTGAFAQEIAAQAFADGRKAFDTGDYDKAVELFDKAAETDPQNPEVFIWKGNALLALGRVDEAAEAWQKALALAPNNASLKKRLDNLTAAQTSVETRIKVVQELLDMGMPRSAYVAGCMLMGTALTEQQKQIVSLLIAEAHEAQAGDAQQSLSMVCYWQNQYPKADAELAARAMLVRVRALARLNDAEKAHNEALALVQKYPTTEAALKARFENARLLERKGNPEAAINACLDALNDKNAKAHLKKDFVFEARVDFIKMLVARFDQPATTDHPAGLALDQLKAAHDPKDDAKIARLLPYLKPITECFGKASLELEIFLIKEFAAPITADSLHYAQIQGILGDALFKSGKRWLAANRGQKDTDTLDSDSRNAIDAYLRAGLIQKAMEVMEFHLKNSMPLAAIEAGDMILQKTKVGTDAILCRMAEICFEQEKAEVLRYERAQKLLPKKIGPLAAKSLEYIQRFWMEMRDETTSLRTLEIADAIAKFYADREYYDVARAVYDALLRPVPASAAPGKAPSDPLATFVAYGKANVSNIEAYADFARKAKLLDGITGQTDLHKKTIAELTAIKIDGPRWMPRFYAKSRNDIANIAGLYAKHGTFGVARGIYLQLSKDPVWLGAEEMRYRAALCLKLKADEAFAKWRETAQPGAKPQQLSLEYKAAIADYIAAAGEMPIGLFVSEALRDVRGIAIAYARAAAWDIAAEVYQKLLDEKLNYAYPEQVRFEIAICEVGKAMPEHALAMLECYTNDLSSKIKKLGADDDLELDEKLQNLKSEIAELQMLESDEKIIKEHNLQYQDTVVKLREIEMQRANRLARQEQQKRASSNAMSAGASPRYQQCGKMTTDAMMRSKPLVSKEEIERRMTVFRQAYKKLSEILRKNQGRPDGDRARDEILVMAEHLSDIGAYDYAAEMLETFLKDFPQDPKQADIRLSIAEAWLAWAASDRTDKTEPAERLAEIAERFGKARAKIDALIKDFADDKAMVVRARLTLANSYLVEARIVEQLSPAQARGRYLTAAKKFLQLASEAGGAVRDDDTFTIVWSIAETLEGHRYWDEAVEVYRLLARRYPVVARSRQIGFRIAVIYHNGMHNYLRAVEAYQECAAANGSDASRIQTLILGIGQQLRSEARWVEALHVYSVFVDSFPRHPQAGEALRSIGEIHQANRAWDEAIRAYTRVIEEYKSGDWARQAQFAIADCHIQLSQWSEAMWAYYHYIEKYSGTPQAQQARDNISILKEIHGYQQLIDEGTSPRCDDAQYTIAEIIEKKLHNNIKAIVEYGKVIKNYPTSGRVDEALFAAGKLYLAAGEIERGGELMRQIYTDHSTSPYCDDALYLLGLAYEKLADETAGITIEKARQNAQAETQTEFYNRARDLNREIDELRDRSQRLRAQGKVDEAEKMLAGKGAVLKEERSLSAQNAFEQSGQIVEALAAQEMANRQDKINGLLRKAIEAYQKASVVTLGDRSAEALMKMAEIYDKRLKDAEQAMLVYEKIVKLFPGTAVAENAVWQRALYFERKGEYEKAKDEYIVFISNYPQSPRVEEASFRLAETYEHLKQWEKAMDSYRNYLDNFPNGKYRQKAQERIVWIQTYRRD